jgi:hypothetical protein
MTRVVSVRIATPDDTVQIGQMLRPFMSQHPLLAGVEVSDEQLHNVIGNLLEYGVIIVSEQADGSLTGLLAGCLTPLWIAPHKHVAVELAWWMQPEHRRGMTAARMVRAFEHWAEEHGAAHVAMSSIPSLGDRPSKLIELLGYRAIEQAHIK